MDVHSKEIRSFNMRQVKSKDTKPEIIVRKFLFSKGFRFRLHDNNLPGKPDLVFKKFRTVIFVNGCFWHGHKDCKYFVLPKTRADWWNEKIEANIRRDQKSLSELKELGWNSLVIWECELKPEKREETLINLYKMILKLKN